MDFSPSRPTSGATPAFLSKGEPGFVFGGRRWVASLRLPCRIKKGATGDKTGQPGNSRCPPNSPVSGLTILGPPLLPGRGSPFIDSLTHPALLSRGMNPIIPVVRREPFDDPAWLFESQVRRLSWDRRHDQLSDGLKEGEAPATV